MSNTTQPLGARLQGLRELRGWTVAEAARAANVSGTAWAGWEAGKNDPSIRALRRVALAFNVSLADILRGVS